METAQGAEPRRLEINPIDCHTLKMQLILSPNGRLLARDTLQGSAEGALPSRLIQAFAISNAAGIVELCSRRDAVEADSVAVFWREFGDSILEALSHAPEMADSSLPAALPIPAGMAADLALRIPAMPGGEYASAALFESLWGEVCDFARHAAAGKGGAKAWLATVNPALRMLGRVTLHLAENKRDAERPFAFMATYTHRLAGGEKPVHLPLARALQEFAGAKNQNALKSLLEPVRVASEKSEWMRDMSGSRRIFQPQAWSPADALRFLHEVPLLEEAGIVVRIPNWWKNGRGTRPVVRVRVGEARKGKVGVDAMLNFSVETVLGEEALSQAELRELLHSEGGLVSLRGEWVEVDPENLRSVMKHWKDAASAHSEGIGFLEAMRLLAGFQPAGKGKDPLAAPPEWSEVVAVGELRNVLEKLGDPVRAADFDPCNHVRATLRPYQVEGVRWLWLLQKLGLGACLADDMGLGKTLQVIALLAKLQSEDRTHREKQTPSLLVAPASLLGNWTAELARFAPNLSCAVVHPSAATSASWRSPEAAASFIENRDLILTTYGQVSRLEWISSRPWRLLVLDEAQAIKNPGSGQTRAVKRIPAAARIALSGTPVENRLGDLWSICDFLNPGLLGSATAFADAVKKMQASEPPDFAPLRRLVRPYLLRRLKTDRRIIADLPDKTEITAWCGLSKRQAALYQQAVGELEKNLQDTSQGIKRSGLVFAFLTRFKQICNHPAQWSGDGAFSPDDSGKFTRLGEIAAEIASRQEKMLVFSQFQEMTAPIAGYLAGIFSREGCVLHGGTPVKQRTELVQAFSSEEGPPFFVLSLKAGGVGLNLTAAAHVVHFDRWWNPAIENQATDRAYRIGQKRNVLVHKFVCRGTIEERINAMIAEKQSLADSVLGPDGGAEKLLTEMSDGELLNLVRLDISSAME